MWLLSTDRAELRFFPSLEEARCAGYAILSHTWGDNEQTFQETQALRTAGNPGDGYNPREHSSPKVRESCILAERHGYRWLWNDTCCIDKTSSSDLSEAINSMFYYYAHAEVCYVYLSDVPQGGDIYHEMPSKRNPYFRRSRWFRRGWTLQELIAPTEVVFLSLDWAILGTKAAFASTLQSITGVPESILSFEQEVWDMSIAERMSWAADRETTRPEDEAYSLMGIFNVHMPTIYGEGRNAFRRLQEEIMRNSIDTSLFAWGGVADSVPRAQSVRPCVHGRSHDRMYLFAASARDFRLCAGYVFSPTNKYVANNLGLSRQKLRASILPSDAATLDSGVPSFEVTPYGVRARMPVVQLGKFTLALLFTSVRNNPLGLLLGKCETGADPQRPLYHPCIETNTNTPCRLVYIDNIVRWSPQLQLRLASAPCGVFYLTHIPPRPREIDRRVVNIGTASPLRVPGFIMARLQKVFTVDLFPNGLHLPRNDDAPVLLRLSAPTPQGFRDTLLVYFGRCTTKQKGESRQPWVKVKFDFRPSTRRVSDESDYALASTGHDCATDHLEYALDGTPHRKMFIVQGWVTVKITLSFARYAYGRVQASAETYVLRSYNGRTHTISSSSLLLVAPESYVWCPECQ